MSVTYGFFNANIVDGNYDRRYSADQLAEYFASLIGNGVSAAIPNAFKVVPSSGLVVNVSAGFSWINGFWSKNDAMYPISVPAAPSSGYRKDIIVLRFSRSDRSIVPVLIQGTVSATAPAPMPEYSRTVDQYDLVLAAIDLSAGSSSITSSMITDLRTDTTYCGIVNTFASILIPTGSIQTDQLADGSVTPEKLNLSSGFNPTGPISLIQGVHYFDSESQLPSPGNTGRLYFVKIPD